ncbi:hypothetical protein EYC80_006764 [Monilinia laxa]|uniref:Uncharacterized protein n=1 Tax=Monilinia laxa TaxID=61186 RepID=A0A5N6JZ59_MONLA|nr:hypothetical protein EYC80_006764 [Monilinia laxa]
METESEVLRRSLTRVFSFGLKGQSLAERTRTIQPPRPQRIKSGLKRVFSLGMADLPILKSVEVCFSCKPPEPFTSDEYAGWVDELPERDKVFGLHLPEGDRVLTERERIRAQEDQIFAEGDRALAERERIRAEGERFFTEEDRTLTEEIESQRQLAPHEYGSIPSEGQDANGQGRRATQSQGPSFGQGPGQSKVASPQPQKFFY